MSSRTELLIEFHRTVNFGNRDNLKARQRQARSTYLDLVEDEVETLISWTLAEEDDPDEVLACLACFRPGSLHHVHETLVERRILYPSEIFHEATSAIARLLVDVVETEDDNRNHALCALAWVGDDEAEHAFARWRRSPQGWASKLFVPPESYCHEAGWELTSNDGRRELFHRTTYPLVTPSEEDPSTMKPVVVSQKSEQSCEWCGRDLTVLLELGLADPRLAYLGLTGRCLRISTCDVCTCFGVIYTQVDFNGGSSWHPANERPEYLPENTEDWGRMPERSLVMGESPRHFMESVNWSMLPGVSFSQLGGIPTWIQNAEFPLCPSCHRPMSFIGQISNEDVEEFSEGIYYTFLCQECLVAATHYQQT